MEKRFLKERYEDPCRQIRRTPYQPKKLCHLRTPVPLVPRGPGRAIQCDPWAGFVDVTERADATQARRSSDSGFNIRIRRSAVRPVPLRDHDAEAIELTDESPGIAGTRRC